MVEFLYWLRKEKALLVLALIATVSVSASEYFRPKRAWRGYSSKAYSPKPVIELPLFFQDWRQQFLKINEPIDRSGLHRGIFLGDDSSISRANRDLFRDAGLSHLLSASGYNCWIVAASFGLSSQVLLALVASRLNGLSYLRLRRLIMPLSSLVGAWLFWSWSNQSPPITRSAALISLKFLLDAFTFRAPFGRLVFIQYLASLALSPGLFRSASFQLTYGCLFGIYYFPKLISGTRPKSAWAAAIWGYLASTFGACLGALPVTWLKFDEINFNGLTTNWFAVPLVSFFIMPLGLIQMFLCLPFESAWLEAAASALGAAATVFTELLLKLLGVWEKL